MKVQSLLSRWESSPSSPTDEQSFSLRLSAEDTAKIHALAEMYPKQSVDSLLSDIFAVTLQEVNEKLNTPSTCDSITH